MANDVATREATFRRAAAKALQRGMTPRDLVHVIDEEAAAITPLTNQQFCRLAWDVEDVQTLFHVDDETAADFLHEIADAMNERLVERGWDVIDALGGNRDFPPNED